jgi:hypothetical protein
MAPKLEPWKWGRSALGAQCWGHGAQAGAVEMGVLAPWAHSAGVMAHCKRSRGGLSALGAQCWGHGAQAGAVEMGS